jgi:hypothetical protein
MLRTKESCEKCRAANILSCKHVEKGRGGIMLNLKSYNSYNSHVTELSKKISESSDDSYCDYTDYNRWYPKLEEVTRRDPFTVRQTNKIWIANKIVLDDQRKPLVFGASKHANIERRNIVEPMSSYLEPVDNRVNQISLGSIATEIKRNNLVRKSFGKSSKFTHAKLSHCQSMPTLPTESEKLSEQNENSLTVVARHLYESYQMNLELRNSKRFETAGYLPLDIKTENNIQPLVKVKIGNRLVLSNQRKPVKLQTNRSSQAHSAPVNPSTLCEIL